MIGGAAVDTTTFDPFAIVLLPANDIYLWRVIASDAAGNTRVVGDSRVVVDTAGPTAASLVAPIGGASGTSSILLDWNASTDALSGFFRYRLQVDTSGVFASRVVDSYLSAPDSTIAFASDTYFWRVIAEDDAGNTTATAVDSFRVIVLPETAPPAAVLLLAPEHLHETTATTVRFRWSDSTDSSLPISYRLLVGAVVDTTVAETFSVATLPANDTYLWRVIVIDGEGNTTVVGDSVLVVDTALPSAPTLVAPIAGAPRASPALLDWTATTDALSGVRRYRLQVGADSSNPASVVDALQASPDSTVSLASRTYVWRVIAEDDAGNTAASTLASFLVPDSSAPAVAYFRTSPDRLATALDTARVEGRIADLDTPAFVTLRRVGPLTTADSVLAVGPDGSWSGIFAVEASGESTTTRFLLTATDLSGNVRRETVALTRVDSTPVVTVSGGVRRISAAFPDSTGVSFSLLQDTAASVSISLGIDTASGDSVEARLDFDSSFAGGMVMARRPAPSLLSDPSLEFAIGTDTASLLSKYLVEFLVFDSAGLPVGSRTDPYDADSAAKTGIRLIFHYDGADFGALESQLKVFYYDAGSGDWKPVSDSPALAVFDLGMDPAADTIGFIVSHFTIFIIAPSGSAASGNLDNVVVFPNPFIPYDGIASTGEPFSGAATAGNMTGIHITGLVSPATISIYNILGEQVDEISNVPNQGLAIWDGRTFSGREAASGIYIFVIRGAGQTAVRKVAIIR